MKIDSRSRCHAGGGETARWTPDQVPAAHTLPLGRVLELLVAAGEVPSVCRLLELLRRTVGAGPALAVEYVLQGGLLKVRQAIDMAGDLVTAGSIAPDLNGSITDPAHALLLALARGQHGDTMFGLRTPVDTAASWPRPTHGGRAGLERLSVLYGLAQDTAWGLHFGPASADAAFEPDVLARLPACACLVREVHRIVSPLDATAGGRVDTASVRLGVRAAALSGRERQICARIAGGHSTSTIAAELGIAISTVMTLRKRAYAKLGIHGRLDLRQLAA